MGDEFGLGPYDVIDVAPGHDAWVLGEEPVIPATSFHEWSSLKPRGPHDGIEVGSHCRSAKLTAVFMTSLPLQSRFPHL